MIEQELRFCSTSSSGSINKDGTKVPFVKLVLTEMNEKGYRLMQMTYNPHNENRILLLFEKNSKHIEKYNEVDI